MRFRYSVFFLIHTIISTSAFCVGYSDKKKQNDAVVDTITYKIDYLKKYILDQNSWHITNPDFSKNIEGLIQFIEGQPIDTILENLKFSGEELQKNVVRLPDEVGDTLQIPGFIPFSELTKKILDIENSVMVEFRRKEMEVPYNLISDIERKVKLIAPNEGMKLFTNSVYFMPDSLKFLDAIPESMIQTTEDFQRILKLDSIRKAIIEQHRVFYNDSIIKAYKDSVISDYRKNTIQNRITSRVKQYNDSVKINNFNVTKVYNDSVVNAVNDTIRFFIGDLINYANYIDTTNLLISNYSNDSKSLVLGREGSHYARVWLKNQQNDSISVLIQSSDKNSLKMLIDDGATITRFSQRQSKEIDFSNLKPVINLENVKERFKLETPWRIGGDGTVGFTQTYLNNWSKGGKSAISMLLVLKGFANYSTLNNKIKWENSLEVRNGWLKPGGTDENGEKYESQKNDDKFEFISRFGVSAFKKWYYSAEVDFETQFFNGYKYPTSINPQPISAFLSPAKTLYKLGLDYKPNKKLSVFISPLTSKTVFIRDTIKINKNNFKIPDGKRKLWVPGLNTDISYKTDITPDVSYETKYKMFINYTAPFEKFDINWENLIIMRVNDYINMRLMLHLIYDDDVLFPVKDSDGKVLYSKPKLQVKELITLGFSYKINKKVFRTRQIN